LTEYKLKDTIGRWAAAYPSTTHIGIQGADPPISEMDKNNCACAPHG
jgi:hypothetical protein